MPQDGQFDLDPSAISLFQEQVDFTDKNTWASFAAGCSFCMVLNMASNNSIPGDELSNIIRTACDGDTIYVGKKGNLLSSFYFGAECSAAMTYDYVEKKAVVNIMPEIKSQGKITVFLMGEYKEKKIIETFLHINPDNYANEYQALASLLGQESNEQNVDSVEPDYGSIPPPNSPHWKESDDYDAYIRSRIAWGEGYLNDDGEFVEF